MWQAIKIRMKESSTNYQYLMKKQQKMQEKIKRRRRKKVQQTIKADNQSNDMKAESQQTINRRRKENYSSTVTNIGLIHI